MNAEFLNPQALSHSVADERSAEQKLKMISQKVNKAMNNIEVALRYREVSFDSRTCSSHTLFSGAANELTKK